MWNSCLRIRWQESCRNVELPRLRIRWEEFYRNVELSRLRIRWQEFCRNVELASLRIRWQEFYRIVELSRLRIRWHWSPLPLILCCRLLGYAGYVCENKNKILTNTSRSHFGSSGWLGFLFSLSFVMFFVLLHVIHFYSGRRVRGWQLGYARYTVFLTVMRQALLCLFCAIVTWVPRQSVSSERTAPFWCSACNLSRPWKLEHFIFLVLSSGSWPWRLWWFSQTTRLLVHAANLRTQFSLDDVPAIQILTQVRSSSRSFSTSSEIFSPSSLQNFREYAEYMLLDGSKTFDHQVSSLS